MTVTTVPARFAEILNRQPLSIDKADREARNVKLRWLIGEDPDGGGTVYAELTVGHHARAKVFMATLDRVTVAPASDGPFRTELPALDIVRIASSHPISRYTAAKLRLYVAEAIVALSREVETGTNAQLLRHFRPAGMA